MCILCALSAFLVPACALDRDAFTFTKYDLQVRVEPGQQRLEVRGTITLRNDSSSAQNHLTLQISSSLHWSTIQLNGEPVEFVSQSYTSDIDHTGSLAEAIVVLPQAVPPGGAIELSIGYEGTISSDTTRLERIGVPKEVAKHNEWDEIGRAFTAVRGAGYVTWYPVAMDSADLSDGNSVFDTLGRWKQREAGASVNIELCVDSSEGQPATAVMNDIPAGASKSDATESPATTCQEHVFSPQGLVSPSFAIGNYSVLSRSSTTIYFLPEHNSAAQNYSLATEVATPFIEEWFGAPRHKIEVIEPPDPQASPFESGSVLFTPLTKTISTEYELTAIHQLTHAAFPSNRLWIYEGLAHFAQALDIENKSGRQAALDFMGAHREAIIAAEKMNAVKTIDGKPDPQRAADESLINTSIEEFYRSKAMYVWWMLRDMVGEKALKQSLAEYAATKDKDKDEEPSYMARLIASHTNRNLEWFFDDWVYRDHGLPDFRVESAYPRKLVKGGYMVTVTVENLGGAGAEVPLVMKMEGGEIRKRLEVRAKSKTSIRIEATSTPQEIVVNDGSVPENDLSNNSYKVVMPN